MAPGVKGADDGMLMEEVDLKVRYKYERSWITGERIALLGLIALGLILVIVGIVLLVMASSAAKKCSEERPTMGSTSAPTHQASKQLELSSAF